MSPSYVALAEREKRRVAALMREPRCGFVVGSNLEGVHGAGCAKAARKYCALRGVGEGRVGRTYAIPTKKTWRDSGLPLATISQYVSAFIKYAREHPYDVFSVTRIGCGYAGYTDAQIAPLFRDAPANVVLPDGWRDLMEGIVDE